MKFHLTDKKNAIITSFDDFLAVYQHGNNYVFLWCFILHFLGLYFKIMFAYSCFIVILHFLYFTTYHLTSYV